MQRFPGFKPLADGALSGRVVLMVGATGGLGAACARECARAGAHVILLGRKVPTLQRLYDSIEKAGHPQPAIYPLNLEGATPADYEQMAETIRSEYGRLDGVIFAAAHFKGLTPLELTDAEEWIRGLHINLGAPQLIVQACLPLLRESDAARVVFSIQESDIGKRANFGAYGVVQSALSSYAQMLASELQHSTVRVLALYPGPMQTDLRGKIYFGAAQGAALPSLFAPAIAWSMDPLSGTWDEVTFDLRHLATQS